MNRIVLQQGHLAPRMRAHPRCGRIAGSPDALRSEPCYERFQCSQFGLLLLRHYQFLCGELVADV